MQDCKFLERECEINDDGNLRKKSRVENADEECIGETVSNRRNEPSISNNRLVDQEPMAKLEKDHGNSTLMTENHVIKSSIVDEICYINRLPPEILSKIFSHIWWWKYIFKHRMVCESWSACRLVCKSWYDILNHDVSLEITSSRKLQRASEFLTNCQFQWLNLHFTFYPYHQDELILGEIPKAMWEKAGTKICELRFCHVQLGDEVIKNVITHCNNLQILKVNLEAFDLNETFCTPKMLERLNILQKNLQTLEIVIDWILSSDWSAYIKYNFRTWNRIFTALIRIFPNITHFRSSVGNTIDSDGWRKLFNCSFSKDSQKIMDKSSVAECLAYALSDNTLDWNRAIEALNKSNLSLTAIKLNYSRSRYMENSKSALLLLFANQKQLKSIEIEICNLESNIDKEMLKSMLMKIVENGQELCKLRYCLLEDEDHEVDDIDFIHWLHTLGQYTKSLHLKEFSTGCIVLYSSNSLTLSPFRPMIINELDQKIKTLFLTYSQIQHLMCHWQWILSDEIFQFIFRHMTNLKTLRIYLSVDNTDFAVTGRSSESENPCNGYSISRLQNLEELGIGWSRSESNGISDAIFHEFNFPKLILLSCIPPKDLSILVDIGQKMPSLKKVIFRKPCDIPLKHLVDFCLTTKKLNFLSINEVQLNLADAEILFEVCPSLRVLKTKSERFFYEPLSKTVRCESDPSFSTP